MQNVFKWDRHIRIVISLLLFYLAGASLNIYSILAIIILLTALSGFCPIYRVMGINKKYAKKLEYLSELPNNNPEPTFIFDNNGEIIYQNKSSKSILPNIKDFSTLSKKLPQEMIDEEDIDSTKFKQGENTYLLRTKGSKEKKGIFTYGFNITELENHAKTLEIINITDALTGIGNRKKIIDDIQAHKNDNISIFIIDIKQFSGINNFLGHLKADNFLIEFSKKLNTFKEKNLDNSWIYRLQANSFALLIDSKCAIKNELDFEIKQIREKLFKYFDDTGLHIENIDVDFDIRISVASKCDCDMSDDFSTQLLNKAEIALSFAKQQNIKYQKFEDISYILDEYKENFQWAKKLKEIFAQKSDAKIVSYFQPIYNLKTKKIEKFETLVRIEDKDEVISPFKFLDVARQMNLLPDITKEMLMQSLEKFKQSDFEFSINISYQDLREKNLISFFTNTLKQYNFPTSKVVIEILEDENMYEFINVISDLKKEGFKIAIDDFGTGYSNFQKLQKLNADYLKIDGSLIKNIAKNPKDLSIVKTICTYAKTIGVKTIAEFVADIDIFDLVKQSGVDYAQGYYISAPNPSTEVKFDGE
jgi:EAL domain-containing protein (putative c-di-GMP-specific phosphodiesterase class I)/GGDEF domain-containing protein